MNYQTCIAAAVIGLFSLAASADDQNPSAGPEGTHATGQASSAPEAELDQGMTTGEKQSDTHAEGHAAAKHKTGEASSAKHSSASSKPDQHSADQSNADRSGTDQTNADQSNADQANAGDNGMAGQEAAASDESQPRLVVVVPEEMQDQVEDLIAFIQSAPNAQVVVVSQEDQTDSDQNQEQDQSNSFAFPETEAE